MKLKRSKPWQILIIEGYSLCALKSAFGEGNVKVRVLAENERQFLNRDLGAYGTLEAVC
jgi:hypothetical protein